MGRLSAGHFDSLMSLRQILLHAFPIACVLLIAALIRWGARRKWLKFLNLCGATFLLITSPVLVLTPDVSHSVEIPGYRVESFERSSPLFFDIPRYFLLHQEDGQQASFLIDIDASRCMNLQTFVQGPRIHFNCIGDPQARPAYIDTEAMVLLSDVSGEVAVIDLNFSPPNGEFSF